MTSPEARDDELGRRVGRALDRRPASPMSIELEVVQRGARHRRARRHVAVGVASVAVVIAGVGVIVRRHAEPTPADVPPVSVPVATVVPAVAVLPASFGPTAYTYARSGGQPRGVALPRVDVWESGSTRIIVRTFSEPVTDGVGPTTTFEPPATTAATDPATDTPPGTLEQLAGDQWVQYRSAQRNMGDNVIVRGVDRKGVEALLAALVEVDGAMAPPAGFDLVEHADAAPASEPVGWYTMVGYGHGQGDEWVTTSPVAPDRASIELAMSFSVGSLRTIHGRQVFEDEAVEVQGRVPAITWLDPSGVLVGYSTLTTLDESVVSQVSFVSQRQFEQLSHDLSSRLAATPALASTEVDGVVLTLRGSDTDVVACVGSGLDEQCAADPNASVNQPPMAGTMDAIVGGQWVIFGYYELGIDGYKTPDLSDDRFIAPDGHALPIASAEADGFLWYVIRVPAGASTVTTSYMNDVGGVVGTIARPIVVGTFG